MTPLSGTFQPCGGGGGGGGGCGETSPWRRTSERETWGERKDERVRKAEPGSEGIDRE